MKVIDLIKKLEVLDQDAEVIVTSSNFELNGETVSVSFIHQYDSGSNKTKIFRDAFDNTKYSKEVWSIISGNTPVVLIS
jgi:uncharacterized protein YkuJ